MNNTQILESFLFIFLWRKEKKRDGRSRKIISIVKDGEEEVSAELKKLKTNEVEESQGENKKEDVFEEEKNLQPQKQQQQPTRSRARRKSKPRKSC